MLAVKKIVKSSLFIIVTAFILSACDESKVTFENVKTLNIQEWKTKNGIRVLYVHAPELPMIDINVVFDAGSVRDSSKPGIAGLANGLLSHGAILNNKILTVDDVSERFEDIGARFAANVSKDKAGVSLRSLTDQKLLNQAITTMQAIINAPTFNAKELKRIKKQLLVSFEGRKQSPSTVASDIFYKGLYGEHPYANPSIGTEKSINKLSRKDLLQFYKKYYVAENTLVTIVGDVDREKAKELAEQLVGALPRGKKAVALVSVKDLQSASTTHYEFPSSQTHIMMGHPGMSRQDKDYFTLYLANHILGGSGFGSRIMEEIREKRGLAYSSYSYFVPMLKRGPFLVGMQTSNNKTDEAMAVLKETISNFVENGPTEKELAHAKKNITGGFPLRIDSNKDISNYLAVIGFYNLPLSYLSDFNQRIEAISLAQINETIKRRIHPEKMFTVTVGTKVNSHGKIF